MACNINTALPAPVCADKEKAIGGFKTRFWVGNLDDIDTTVGIKGFTYDLNGNISAIAFKATKGTYEFNANKNGVGATAARTRTEFGSFFSVHTVTFKYFDITATQRAILDNLGTADALFVIAETNSGQFEVFGKDLGLTLGDAGEKNFGLLVTDDTTSNITLTSPGEKESPVPFFVTDYSATLTALIALEA